ncbi:transposase [Armatimonas sp.]|uniref:transposase n=1 Tax=Armatimonas sp. TaxID=1872638 RepID=UPI0037511513
MKAGEMTDEPGTHPKGRVLAILQEADKGDKKLVDLCREKGISQNTFYTWKKKFQGMPTNEVKRLRAERDLDIGILKELAQKNSSPTSWVPG